MKGFRQVTSKFPRAESFSSMGRLNGSFYFSTEKLAFYPENSGGSILFKMFALILLIDHICFIYRLT